MGPAYLSWGCPASEDQPHPPKFLCGFRVGKDRALVFLSSGVEGSRELIKG